MALQTHALAEQIGENRLKIWLKAMLGFIYADLGELDSAIEAADQALTQADELGQIIMQCWSRYTRAYIYTIQGDWNAGIELCEEGMRLYQPVDNKVSRIYIGLIAPEVFLGAERVEEAEKWLAQFLPLAHQARATHYEAIGMRIQGQIYAYKKMWREAEQSFEQATATFQSSGSQLELGRLLYYAGLMEIERDQPGPARKFLPRALEIFKTSNAKPWIERAQGAFDRLANN